MQEACYRGRSAATLRIASAWIECLQPAADALGHDGDRLIGVGTIAGGGALDSQTRSLMQELLLDIWQASHKTVLFITHDIDESILHGDRVYMMTAPSC
jgi:ABC-type microcin C transport system duplicated ATPase subunit YejF